MSGSIGLKEGFDEPALASQRVFRALLTALSNPGHICTVDYLSHPPEEIGVAASAVALTLVDFETSLWISPDLRGSEVERWIKFHCGCPITNVPATAVFALAKTTFPALQAFNQGEAKYPDQSTTLILDLPSLREGEKVVLEGPGIDGRTTIYPSELPESFWAQWKGNAADFQFGVDIFLCSGGELIGLPRTARIIE